MQRAEVVEVDPQGTDALVLLREAAIEARSLYPELFEPGTPWPTNVPNPERGVYLIAYQSGRPVACGAIRPLDGGTGEVRRMFVGKAVRRHGLAKAVLRALEARALVLGYTKLRLETGYKQLPAISLYQAQGYARIEPFGQYAGDPTSVCFEKALHGESSDA